jgi:hypothetical protein
MASSWVDFPAAYVAARRSGVAPSRTARYRDLASGYYASRTDTARKTRNHIRQEQALGYTVTLVPAA